MTTNEKITAIDANFSQKEKIAFIENKIRAECEWLLKDGCESGLPVEECIKKFDCRYCYWGNQYFSTQLSDLLYVIGRDETRVTIGPDTEMETWQMVYLDVLGKYNLSKSFKENLEQSPELCEFIYQLLIK